MDFGAPGGGWFGRRAARLLFGWCGHDRSQKNFPPDCFAKLRMVLSVRAISDFVPMLMRAKPGPISLERSRTKMPVRVSLAKSAGPCGPKSARRKFPALGYVVTPSFDNCAANSFRVRRVALTYFLMAARFLSAASAATRAARFTG